GLRLVECKVGVGDQLVDIGAVVGRNGNAGAAADVQDVFIDVKGLPQFLEHGADDVADHARIPAIGYNHDEFIAAQTIDLAAAVHHPGQAPRHLDEKLIAGRMADGVVYVLETVEIEQRDRGRPQIAFRTDRARQLDLQ